MARSVDVPLTIDDFQRISERTPLLADFKPSGSYVMEDLHSVGGLPAVCQLLLKGRPSARRLPDGNGEITPRERNQIAWT